MSRAQRESQMLDVAEEMFAELGYNGVSMDGIAERCGVSKPMLYEYFGSKDGLLQAAIARARKGLYEATSEAMSGGDSPHEVLRLGMLAYFTYMDTRHAATSMLLREPLLLSDAAEATRRQQGDLIAPILAAFAPTVPPATIEAYTEIIVGACERLTLWRTARPGFTPADAATAMTDFCWRGLSPHIKDPEP